LATVIKAGAASEKGAVLRRLARVDLADHLAEARAVLDEARRQAERIVAEARKEAERLRGDARQAAHDDGRREGFERGRAEGFEAAKSEEMQRFSIENDLILADFRRILDEIDQKKADLQLAARQNLLHFAVDLARKLTFALGEFSHDSATANLDRALQLIESKTDLTVRANPKDIEAIQTFAASLSERIEQADAMKIIADDSIAPGGCVVGNEQTEVDATLETQTEELVTLLLGRLRPA